MDKKVILISIDGMRPDGLQQCGNDYVKQLEKDCLYTYNAQSVMPSVTLPCHFSMTHSVTPQRHGILTNTYVPQVRPVDGIFELVSQNRGVSVMFYGWEPLRDIAVPGTLKAAKYISAYMKDDTDTPLTDEALKTIEEFKPDFAFLYLVETDGGGHNNGWMSEEYLRRISIAIDNTKRVIEKFGEEYTIIIVADHGGSDRSHGMDIPEHMTIPFFFRGDEFTPGELKEAATLLDIAPTIADVMGIEFAPEWEGKSLINR